MKKEMTIEMLRAKGELVGKRYLSKNGEPPVGYRETFFIDEEVYHHYFFEKEEHYMGCAPVQYVCKCSEMRKIK